jgi:outer membrane protein assembly factor BamB
MMRRTLLVSGLLLVSGCGSLSLPSLPLPWGERLPVLPTLSAPSPAKVAWSASVAKSGEYVLVPAAGQEVIYVAAANGTVTTISEATGRTSGSFEAAKRLTAGVGYGENRIVVGNELGEVIATDTAGKVLWKAAISGELLAQPHVLPGLVIVRTADGRVVGLNALDGKRKWSYQRPTPPLTLRSTAGVISGRGTIYVGFPGGKLVALEAESGKPTWEATLSLPRGATELERIADVGGLPVLDGTRVCAAVYQGRSGCVETLNGNVLWSREISGATGMAADSKNLYFADELGNIIALDKVSGASVWKQEALVKRKPGNPVVFAGRVWLGDSTGTVHALSVDNGSLVGRISTDGSPVESLSLISDTLVAQTDKGGVFGIR